eukprot:1160182-Pelagomonas_calceolata.AAC.3
MMVVSCLAEVKLQVGGSMKKIFTKGPDLVVLQQVRVSPHMALTSTPSMTPKCSRKQTIPFPYMTCIKS